MLRIYLIWGGLIFIAIKVIPYITTYLFGLGPALIVSLFGIIVTFYASYKGSLEMLKFAKNKKK